jgi:hypothetical protein
MMTKAVFFILCIHEVTDIILRCAITADIFVLAVLASDYLYGIG